MSIVGQTIKNAFRNLLGATSAADLARADRAAVQKTFSLQFSDAATAATAIGDSPVFDVDAPNGIRILTAKVIFGVDVVADVSDFATVTLAQHKAPTVATPVAIASFATSSGDTVGFTPNAMALTVTTPDTIVPFGASVSFGVAKAGLGSALTAAAGTAGQSCSIRFTYEEL